MTLEINLTVWNFCCVEVVNKQDLIRIIREGTDLEAECHSCQVDSLLWTYKPPNGSPADIVIGRELIRKNSPAENELWFNIFINSTTCNYNLFVPSIQMKRAGLFGCWESLNATRINIVVISEQIILYMSSLKYIYDCG